MLVFPFLSIQRFIGCRHLIRHFYFRAFVSHVSETDMWLKSIGTGFLHQQFEGFGDIPFA